MEPSATAATMETDAAPATVDAESPPRRLIITKMVLENFKSYAGVQEIGPFHHCFSAVVGPNGSGKSNVIDAMLFVFGKRAKKLRLNKVSELIHSSSSQSKANAATVSVHVAEIVDTSPTAYEFVPGTETVISRTAKADNSSSYYLNGKSCKFGQVAAYLGSKGIDLDNNRFLILQGEVEMISMMPPKGKTPDSDDGLLEYLEDIIGSSKFVPDTEKAAEQLESLAEQRNEKLNRVKAVQKEKENLSGAKLEAVALLRKDRQIRAQYNVLYQWLVDSYSLEMPKAQQKETEDELKNTEEQATEMEGRLSTLQTEVRQNTKLHNKLHDELVKTQEEFSAYERRDIKLREELKHGKSQKKKMQQKISKQRETESTCLQEMENAKAVIPQLEEQLVEMEQYRSEHEAALEEIYEGIKEITQDLRVQLEQASEKLAPIKQERAAFKDAHDIVATELQLLEDGVSRARTKLAEAEAELETIDDQKANKRQELQAAEDELAATGDRIKEAEREEKQLVQEEPNLAKRFTQIMTKLEDIKSAQQAAGGPQVNPTVKSILRAARKGGALDKAGIIGRLGDLATTPDDYDIAVSTACGSLDHIVIRTSAGAGQCLEFLRKNNLGRASFICLDKLKKGAHDRQVETPENAPRLFDLINPIRSELAPALFLSIGNTLVAPDLETASRWCYDFGKRWRVVTLDGKLFETSGTQSGGGNTVRRGKMKLASGKSNMMVDADDETATSDLEKEADMLERGLRECRDRRKSLTSEVRSLKKSAKLIESKIPKLSLDIAGCDTTREELTKLIPDLRSHCELNATDEQAANELRERVDACEKDLVTCSKKATKLEKEVEQLQKSIVDAGGKKLKQQQGIVSKVKEDQKKTEKELATAKVTISSNDKAAKKALKLRETAEQELVQCEEEIDQTKTKLASLEQDAVKVAEDVERVKEIEADARAVLEEKSNEFGELKKAKADLKCLEVELVGKLDELKKQISQGESKISKWNTELDQLRSAEEESGSELSFEEDDSDDDSAKSVGSDEGMQVETNPKKMPLPVLDKAELSAYDKDEIKKNIEILEHERNEMAKCANMGAIAEYRKKEEDYLLRYVSRRFTLWQYLTSRLESVSELDTVTASKNEARRTYEDLRRQRLEMFMDGFSRITLKLKELYQMITLGGDAELELVDSLDPFSEGIMFSVRPPKKSWKNICNLSGGEKTLSSLALVFALHHYKPTPLYVMDEIDAALDFKNVSIVANYIKERTRNAQFVIISLRNNMFELADRLVGIYKTDNCTKSLAIDPHAFAVNAETTPTNSNQAPLSIRERSSNVGSPSSTERDELSTSKAVSFSSGAAETENTVS